jgi:hypothetical protein
MHAHTHTPEKQEELESLDNSVLSILHLLSAVPELMHDEHSYLEEETDTIYRFGRDSC